MDPLALLLTLSVISSGLVISGFVIAAKRFYFG